MNRDDSAGDVSAIDVAYVAQLARIDLTDAERSTFQRQLGEVVSYVNKIRGLNTAGIEPTAHAVAVQNVLRDDAVRSGLDHQTVMANAPETFQELYKVPQIME